MAQLPPQATRSATTLPLRNDEKIHLHFLLVLFPFCCVKKPRRCAASPVFFALHKEKITAYKNAIYLFIVPYNFSHRKMIGGRGNAPFQSEGKW